MMPSPRILTAALMVAVVVALMTMAGCATSIPIGESGKYGVVDFELKYRLPELDARHEDYFPYSADFLLSPNRPEPQNVK